MRCCAIMWALLAAAPAMAEEARDLCADRPGLGTPACTVEKGSVVFEVGLADWTRDASGGSRTDMLQAGEALLRLGLSNNLEAQLGWTAWGHEHVRDRQSGLTENRSGVGDVTLALRQNLANPDGSGFSLAVMPYASFPVGRPPVGAGDWGAGVSLPMSQDLGGVSLSATPRIDAAVDGDGKGRHLGFGTVLGLGFNLSGSVSASTEISLYRDNDPAGHATEALAGFSLGWQPGADSQWDAGANLGLNGSSPDVQLYFGYVHRF